LKILPLLRGAINIMAKDNNPSNEVSFISDFNIFWVKMKIPLTMDIEDKRSTTPLSDRKALVTISMFCR
jgi:hypothetical protein